MLKLCRPLCVLPFTVDIGGITHPPALAQASTTIFSVQTCNHKLFSPPLERRPLTGGVLTESPVRAYSKAKLLHFWLASFSVSAKYWLMIFWSTAHLLLVRSFKGLHRVSAGCLFIKDQHHVVPAREPLNRCLIHSFLKNQQPSPWRASSSVQSPSLPGQSAFLWKQLLHWLRRLEVAQALVGASGTFN